MKKAAGNLPVLLIADPGNSRDVLLALLRTIPRLEVSILKTEDVQNLPEWLSPALVILDGRNPGFAIGRSISNLQTLGCDASMIVLGDEPFPINARREPDGLYFLPHSVSAAEFIDLVCQTVAPHLLFSFEEEQVEPVVDPAIL